MRWTPLRLVTVAAVGAGIALAPQASAAPASTGAAPDAASAADYLVAQLVGGTHYESFPGFADLGLTIDGALALVATGDHDADLTRIVGYVGVHQNDYTLLTGAQSGFASGGAVGKVALLAEAVGADPGAFGGADLIAGLDRLVCTAASADVCAGAGNYRYTSSTFGQVLGVLAQLRAGDAAGAARPIAYLESLQHGDGSFPSVLPDPGDHAVGDSDSTAAAAMALALVPGAAARADLVSALRWLASVQEHDGGFPGASGDSVNSAGLAVQALCLDAQTYADQIAAARSFLASQQQTDGGFAVAAGQAGSDVRATAQALGGAVGTPFGSLLANLAAEQASAKGANYLVAELTGGDHYTSSFNGSTFDDQGLTADGLFALLGAGGHPSTVAAILAYLRGQVGAYADPTGAAGGPYSGALAKLAIVAEATGGDPHSFGGTDLLTPLAKDVCTARIAGNFSPCTAAGDFVNAFSTVSQALGVLALQASPIAGDHVTVTSPVVVRLHQLQCADGGFSSTLIAAGAPCTSEVDTTAFAVQALESVAGTDVWLGAAQKYLQNRQRAGGLYPGAAGDNSNSTALAAQALQSLVGALIAPTADPPGAPLGAPVVVWQAALTGLDSLAVSSGGFGITTATTADLRSSTQAVAATAQVTLLALSGAPVRSLPRASAPTGPGGPTTTSSPPTTSPTPPPPVTSSRSSAPPSGSTSSSAGSTTPSASRSAAPSTSGGTAPVSLADTGVTTGQQLGWAVALIVAGAALSFAGRRRSASGTRTAPSRRRRH